MCCLYYYDHGTIEDVGRIVGNEGTAGVYLTVTKST